MAWFALSGVSSFSSVPSSLTLYRYWKYGSPGSRSLPMNQTVRLSGSTRSTRSTFQSPLVIRFSSLPVSRS